MAVNTARTDKAARGYRSNAVAGLSDQKMLEKGLHGLVVYLNRAMIIHDQAGDEAADMRKAQSLSDADRLLGFLMQLADVNSEMGSTLVDCYTGIQQLISSALNGNGDESRRDLGHALDQARALERAFKKIEGGGLYGQAH